MEYIYIHDIPLSSIIAAERPPLCRSTMAPSARLSVLSLGPRFRRDGIQGTGQFYDGRDAIGP